MAIALNLTVKVKQDPATLAQLDQLAAAFPTMVQPLMDQALAASERVHFARVLVIDRTYLQVLTEFDGDPLEYTTFFLEKLGPVFKAIFALVENAPPWEELQDPNRFFEYTSSKNLRALGDSADPKRGYLFSALGEKTVKELKALTAAPAARAA
jgi:hypothetical protein